MTTRKSIDHLLNRVDETVRFAEEQLKEKSRQESVNETEYTEALMQLEETYNDLMKTMNSASPEQRELLHRKRLLLQQIQNNMILSDH